MKISLVSIFVNSPTDAYKFYTEILGFQSHTYMPEAQLAIVVSAEDPTGTALLLEPNATDWAKTYQAAVYGAGLPIIVFTVDDIESEVARLKTNGVEFSKEIAKTDWGLLAIFDDTCGNLIQLIQND